MFQTEVAKKIEARILNNIFFREIVLFMRLCGKMGYKKAGRPQMTIHV
jgi:hypothetical protein